jgi:hypothetical protein
MKNYAFALAFAIILINAEAQHERVKIDPEVAAMARKDISPIRSEKFTVKLFSEIDHSVKGESWNSQLVKVKNIHHIPDELELIKEQKTTDKLKHIKGNPSTHESDNNLRIGPGIGSSFAVNFFDLTTPPDNSLAISNEGIIVAVANSTIEYKNESGSNLYSSTFEEFFNDNTLTSTPFDPVVLFDSEWERFILVVLHGSTAATSKVLICFSQSSDPRDGWNYYQLTGNPLDGNDWFDYPKIGISSNDLFITGNLFSSSKSFEEAIIYQISKVRGYYGMDMQGIYWHNISEEPFTIVPASYGQEGNYGTGIYCVATDNNSVFYDEYEIVEITDYYDSDPELNVYSIDVEDFHLFGNALQKGTDVTLDNGDYRGLSAFYLNGYIHFVFQSEREENYSGINYNRIKLSNLTYQNWIYGLDGYDYNYPSVASYGTDMYDKSVMISFLRSSSSIYPEMRAVGVDHDGNWTSSTLVKGGEHYVDFLTANGQTRWGDYTGACRRHGTSQPEVWISGCYGTDDHWFSSWAAQVKEFYVGEHEFVKKEESTINVYPNPVIDRFTIEFEVTESADLHIELHKLNGNFIKSLYNSYTKPGGYQFSFNKNVLPPAIYVLTLVSNGKILKYEKVVIL